MAYLRWRALWDRLNRDDVVQDFSDCLDASLVDIGVIWRQTESLHGYLNNILRSDLNLGKEEQKFIKATGHCEHLDAVGHQSCKSIMNEKTPLLHKIMCVLSDACNKFFARYVVSFYAYIYLE